MISFISVKAFEIEKSCFLVEGFKKFLKSVNVFDIYFIWTIESFTNSFTFLSFNPYLLKELKELKLEEVLATIGHSNIKNLEVINKLSVEDTETRYKSSVFKVTFYDNDLKQTCIGFVHQNRDGSHTKDFDCK